MSPRVPRACSPAARIALTLTLTLGIATASSHAAQAQEKKYGFDSKHAGTGAAFTDAEKQKIRDCLAKLKDLTITIKGDVTYSGSDIAKDLEKMLDDGRLGKGVGAEKGYDASTDKKAADGPRMNIADYAIKSATNMALGDLLAHEWRHTRQTDPSKFKREAEAYQVGKEVLLLKGGDADHPLYKSDAEAEDENKKAAAKAEKKLKDSNAPAERPDKNGSDHHQGFFMLHNPTRVEVLKADGTVDQAPGLPQRLFMHMQSIDLGSFERLLVFGCDTTDGSHPVGALTVFDIGSTGIIARRDSLLPGLKYPISSSWDAVNHRLYVLDAHASGPGIVILEDLNGDFVPDVQRATPFANRAFPGVATALAIHLEQHPQLGAGLQVWSDDERGVDHEVASTSTTFLRDLNGDLVADAATPIGESETSTHAPTICVAPVAGNASLQLAATIGHTIQVRRTDATGDPTFAVLATVGAPTADMFTVALSQALQAGQYVIAVDVTDNTRPVLPTAVGAIAVGMPGLGLWGGSALAALLALAGGLAATRAARRAA